MSVTGSEIAPCEGIVTCNWQLKRQQTVRETLSGDQAVIKLGRSYWMVDVKVDAPDLETFRLWKAFIARRQGSRFTFLLDRRFSASPADPTVSSDAGLDISSVVASTCTVNLTGVGSWAAKAGDLISYVTANAGFWVGEVVADATASAGAIALTVEPEPVAPNATPAVRRIQAYGEFALEDEPKFTDNWRSRSLTFTARQVLR